MTLPIEIYAIPSRTSLDNAVTPFHPENGYVIDQRDFKLEERIKKIKAMGGKINDYIDFHVDPLYIEIVSGSFSLNKAGLNQNVGSWYKFSPEMLELLKRLRVQIIFPGNEGDEIQDELNYRANQSFECRIWDISLELGQISFNYFYPTDFGPLPPDKEYYNHGIHKELREGFRLFVPSNLDLLKKVKLKFFLVEPTEEPQPQESAPSSPSQK